MHKLIGMVALSAVVIVLAGSTKAGNPVSYTLSAADAARQADRPAPTVQIQTVEQRERRVVIDREPSSDDGFTASELIYIPADTPVTGTGG